MRIFLQKRFERWAEKEAIGEAQLVETAKEAFAGQFEADLGGYLFKKRLAREGEGKSGGYRTILCFRKADADRIFFVHGFAKGAKGSISASERKALMKLANGLVSATEEQLHQLLTEGLLVQIGENVDEEEK